MLIFFFYQSPEGECQLPSDSLKTAYQPIFIFFKAAFYHVGLVQPNGNIWPIRSAQVLPAFRKLLPPQVVINVSLFAILAFSPYPKPGTTFALHCPSTAPSSRDVLNQFSSSISRVPADSLSMQGEIRPPEQASALPYIYQWSPWSYSYYNQ